MRHDDLKRERHCVRRVEAKGGEFGFDRQMVTNGCIVSNQNACLLHAERRHKLKMVNGQMLDNLISRRLIAKLISIGLRLRVKTCSSY